MFAEALACGGALGKADAWRERERERGNLGPKTRGQRRRNVRKHSANPVKRLDRQVQHRRVAAIEAGWMVGDLQPERHGLGVQARAECAHQRWCPRSRRCANTRAGVPVDGVDFEHRRSEHHEESRGQRRQLLGEPNAHGHAGTDRAAVVCAAIGGRDTDAQPRRRDDRARRRRRLIDDPSGLPAAAIRRWHPIAPS